MSYLLDTNVISEFSKNKPDIKMQNWFNKIPSEMLYISVLTLGEIRKGIENPKVKDRKKDLILWLEYELTSWFENRILNIDKEVADRWGFLTATVKRSLPAIDGVLAATALANNLKMVTRNVKDFDLPGLEVINPFD